VSNIQTAINQIQDAMGALSGIKAAPDYVPDAAKDFPFVIAYEGPGFWSVNAVGVDGTGNYGEKKWLGDIIIELHVARKDMTRDTQQIAYYSDRIPNAILREFISDQLGNSGDGIARIESSGLVFLQYYTTQGIGEHIGIIYRVKEYKIRSNIT